MGKHGPRNVRIAEPEPVSGHPERGRPQLTDEERVRERMKRFATEDTTLSPSRAASSAAAPAEQPVRRPLFDPKRPKVDAPGIHVARRALTEMGQRGRRNDPKAQDDDVTHWTHFDA